MVELVSIGEFARLACLSPKALRLYDQSGLLPAARIDVTSGYRWYAVGQLEAARLIAALRQLGMPLALIGPILPLEDAERAGRISEWWSGVQVENAARQQLAGLLVDRLSGGGSVVESMVEVALRELPARKLLCQMQHVHRDGLMAVGKEFIGTFREAGVRPGSGAAGAPFVIYYGEVNQDSDGPIEWCWPVPEEQAQELAARFPGLTLRTDPAHQEAYTHQGPAAQLGAARAALAGERLLAWVREQHLRPVGGFRVMYLGGAANGGSGPDCDLVVPVR
ncbi:MerR family transcriptional regulator [Actinocrinis puniceicyclus]|uniref:MerR family transcriptional regulator n=1 Tax=Actinocrinis puniceicyclus TaxID=977794 RepID=A0A8J7WTC0_9ACTN|nr:MerR family transcriptional regulator [Actinocrinis puniceicyclus]MBS2965642.1 MerR family transcriptional regulator [Actinocrinis puniceicyclus]